MPTVRQHSGWTDRQAIAIPRFVLRALRSRKSKDGEKVPFLMAVRLYPNQIENKNTLFSSTWSTLYYMSVLF